VRTDVRLIAASHRDLRARAASEEFRPDLYYRLSVFTIELPPLRERGEDLGMLVQHYVRRFSRELGRDVREVAAETLGRLREYAWPGNIRELQSVLKQALLQASGAVLLPAFLPDSLRGAQTNREIPTDNSDLGLRAFIRQRLAPDASDLYAEVHREVDRILLTLALDYAQGSQRQAARLLGIARQTLRLKLRELGLHVTHSVEPDEDD
jgi:two-component system nitrogen regulation response regulator GlnG